MKINHKEKILRMEGYIYQARLPDTAECLQSGQNHRLV